MAQLRIQDVKKQFGGSDVLKGISLDIADGEFLTIVGPSGCGKSTLLRIIAGLERQSAGHLTLGDTVMDQIRPSERDLAMVFQSYALYPHLTVAENIAAPLRMRLLTHWQRQALIRRLIPGTAAKDVFIRDRVKQICQTLGLEALAERKPAQLSGGQRQRVAVGRAIVREPAAFLFDEPLSNLDAKLRVHMRAELTQLHADLGATFIYVTHDQVEAMTMSDRIAVMMDGELVQVGTPDEIYDNPTDVRVAEFIGSPKINLLPATVNLRHEICLFEKPIGLSSELPPGSQLSLGIRPENLHLGEAANCHLSARIVLRENLGAEVYLHTQVEELDTPLLVRLNHKAGQGIQQGQRLELHFLAENVLLFDANGKRASRSAQPIGELVNEAGH